MDYTKTGDRLNEKHRAKYTRNLCYFYNYMWICNYLSKNFT